MASSSGQIMPRCCVLASERMQTTHYVALALAVLAAGAPARVADMHAYPTVERVEYVLECMQRNAGKQEFLYKCACVIDEIAKQYAYDDFVEASTAARFQSLGGERGGVFRDPPQTRDAAKRYRSEERRVGKEGRRGGGE